MVESVLYFVNFIQGICSVEVLVLLDTKMWVLLLLVNQKLSRFVLQRWRWRHTKDRDTQPKLTFPKEPNPKTLHQNYIKYVKLNKFHLPSVQSSNNEKISSQSAKKCIQYEQNSVKLRQLRFRACGLVFFF